MSWTKKQKGTKSVLKFDGTFLVPDVHAVRQDFVAVLATRDHVEVEVTNLTDIDTAALQLLLAARQTARLSNKSFCLTGDTTIVAAAAARVGLAFRS